jgi:RimJ/RimL family protein N-acetyltransferase
MSLMEIPTITTSRLILRAFTEEHAVPLHRVLGQEGVLRYFPNSSPPPLDRVQKIIADQLKHWEEYGYGWWAVALRSGSEFIGWGGLQFLPETKEIEVAYLLGRPFWGKGLATEAGRASLRYGFDDLGLETIVGIVHPENMASQRVLDKLGLLFVDRAHYFGIDVYRYSMERSSYYEVYGEKE